MIQQDSEDANLKFWKRRPKYLLMFDDLHLLSASESLGALVPALA